MADHDSLYHRLFSHPGMIAQLLRDFVDEPWVEDLDLSAMRRVNAKLHADTGERRDGDMVWRIPVKDGSNLYLLLLLEFQSTPERWMALRVMVYVGLLYQHLINENLVRPGQRLPPVLPMVLYNGDPRWVMPPSLRELIDLPPESPFWRWQPDMRYHLIDEGAWTTEDLAARESLAALLFRLEHCREPSQIVPLVDAVIEWFQRNGDFEPLRPLFAMLTSRVMRMGDGADPAIRVSENLLEVRTMLATRAQEWQRQWKEEGLQEGRQEGLQEGRQEGRRQGESIILRRILERRFGVLPDWARQRLSSADTALLEDWSLRVLDAESLDDVFR
ncbi:MAG: Rpn family recombination-promoting nuclease/putative transposase [Alphaproteobacteria bacterium]|nr:Rpn family recombination-promoting nuclease/putative transposase [Alphaproteobacteria bacterium]